MSPFQAETKLTEIAFPFREMILEQAFSQLFWQSGQINLPPQLETVNDLANFIHWDVEKVCQRLTEIQVHSENTLLSCQQLANLMNNAVSFVILDVREDQLFAAGHINDSISIGLISLPENFATWQEQQKVVITLGSDDEQAFSACLYLKEMGLEKVFYLMGGYSAWAEFYVQPN